MHYVTCRIIRHRENVLVRLLIVFCMRVFTHSVNLSEFIFTYGYMFGFHIVCLRSGMSFYCYVLIFDIFPLSIDYISLTAFFVLEWLIIFQIILNFSF